MTDKHKAAHKGNKRAPAARDAVVGDAKALGEEIQLRAYYRYCERASAPGAELDDWLAAEQEVLATHAARSSSPAPAVGKARNHSR